MKIQRKNMLLMILVIGFIARIGFMLIYSDIEKDYYWEFGNIAKNLQAGNGYSLFYFRNDTLQQDYTPLAKPYPSAFMPPAYVYYLYPFLTIDNVELRNSLIFISQIILSLFLILIIYYFSSKYFSERIGLISAFIVALLPEFIYSCVLYNAVIHYHLLIILSLFLLLDKDFHTDNKKIIPFFILSVLILYFRSEFVVFLFLIFIIFLFKKQFKLFFTGVAIIIILFSPWVIRNYVVFNKFVPLTTSGGLNLYRGHNQIAIGNWGSRDFINDIKNKNSGDNFEIIYNEYYFNKAKESISGNLSSEIKLFFIKIYNLWIINPGDARSFNLAYLIPSLTILILAVIGFIKTFSLAKYKFIYLFILYSTLIAVMFLALPRYQTMMKITFIPFAAYSIDFFISKLKNQIG
jgi:hypothetical protein